MLRALLKSGLPLPASLLSAYGPRLATRRRDKTFLLCVIGAYGPLLSDLLGGVSEPFVFLDIGANVGLFSLVAAANPNCRSVLAFEPVPESYRYLVRNCELNRAANVTPYCAAVTDRSERIVDLAIVSGHSGLAHVSDAPSLAQGTSALVAGPETLNAILRRAPKLRIVAKIDVEGAELEVMRALAATDFHERISDIVIEIGPERLGAADVAALQEVLQRLGFEEVTRRQGASIYDAHMRRRSSPAG